MPPPYSSGPPMGADMFVKGVSLGVLQIHLHFVTFTILAVLNYTYTTLT